MVVMFCGCEDFKKNLRKFSKCDLVIFGFNKFSLQFLTEDYYLLVDKLKNISFKHKTKFILTFYINKLTRKYLGGILIKNGKIKQIFGDCFTKKHLSFKVENKIVSILFYYDLYSKRGKDVTKFSSLIIGIDDDEVLNNIAFLDNKFFSKLILVGYDVKINCGNLKKNENTEKMYANIFYKI